MSLAKVDAVCEITAGFWHNSTRLVVLLYPATPTNYIFVGDMKASIAVQNH
jgi:hypothetical protein